MARSPRPQENNKNKKKTLKRRLLSTKKKKKKKKASQCAPSTLSLVVVFVSALTFDEPEKTQAGNNDVENNDGDDARFGHLLRDRWLDADL
jgi:hypothetical protein